MSKQDELSPLWCPVCNFVIDKIGSSDYYSIFECCKDCALEFAEKNREMWDSGWRPSGEELNTYIKKRRTSVIKFEVL
jgi:hypothetical protein